MQGYQFKQCTQPKHERFDRSIICIADSCAQESRVACVKCVKEKHADHAQQCIMMEDLLENKLQQLPQASSDLSDRIGQLTKVIEDTGTQEDRLTEELFEEFTSSAIKSIELERVGLTERYREKQEYYSDLIKELVSNFTGFFSLHQVRAIYQQFASGQINQAEFDLQLNTYFGSSERSEKRTLLTTSYESCLSKMPNINEQETKYLKEKVKEEISKLKDLVRISGQWFFIAPQINNYNNNLKPKEGGKVVEFGTQDSQQYVYGSMALKSGSYHQWTYKFEETNAGMSYNTVYIGVVLDSYREDLNQMFSYGKCVYLDINNNAFTQYLTLKAGKKTLSQVIKENNVNKQPTLIQFFLDTKGKSLIIQDSEELSKYEYSNKIIKKQINSSQNSGNVSAHLTYFKQGNSYRPIAMNYSGTFRLSLV